MRFHMDRYADRKYYLTHRNAEWLILTHMGLKLKNFATNYLFWTREGT